MESTHFPPGHGTALIVGSLISKSENSTKNERARRTDIFQDVDSLVTLLSADRVLLPFPRESLP